MKAVIPAAGMGKRFHPWTLQNAKELLPVIDPQTKKISGVIDIVVREAREAGCTDVLVITALGKSGLKEHLAKQQIGGYIPEDVRLHYTDQQAPKGLGDAVLCAKNFIGTENFAVLLGDDFYSSNPVKDLLCAYEEIKSDPKFGAILTVQRLPRQILSRYGVVKVKNEGRIMQVEDMVEKPETPPSDFAITGRYILSNKIFSHICDVAPDKKGEIQITDAMKKMISNGYNVYCIEMKGKRYDAGDPASWLNTITEVGLGGNGQNNKNSPLVPISALKCGVLRHSLKWRVFELWSALQEKNLRIFLCQENSAEFSLEVRGFKPCAPQ